MGEHGQAAARAEVRGGGEAAVFPAWWMTAALWAGGLVGMVGVPLLAWWLG